MKVIFLFLGLIIFTVGKANESKVIFDANCKACHTIGNGRLVGPDLKNISDKRSSDWLFSFIKSSQKMIKAGDAEAVKVYNEYGKILMPDPPISEMQISEVLTYIKKVSSGEIVQEETVAVVEVALSAENVDRGQKYFSGKLKLSGKGATCLSCHNLKDDNSFPGGNLAKDLTETYKLMGSAGIKAILKSPPFPAMAESYKNHQLTDEEIMDLTSYLRYVNEESIYNHPRNFGAGFLSLGFLVFFMFLSGIIVHFFNRKRKSVNDKVLSRKSNVIN
jgi:mono/diheme cytochrome c family protein